MSKTREQDKEIRDAESELKRLLRLPPEEFAKYADKVFDGWLRRRRVKSSVSS